jgi:uncharacterized protein YecE (DUF72 family)
MKFRVGTSGYSYKEWKGSFYPEQLSDKKMLAYYAERFSTVEINSMFRKFPAANVVELWAEQVPDSFRFALKARQTITHFRRLKDFEEQTDDFIDRASILGIRRGPLLFQLPPNFRKDVPRLDTFLAYVAGRVSVVFQFQHESWFDEEVYRCLRAHTAALCTVDGDEAVTEQLVATTDWGYVRLRGERYTAAGLKRWLDKLRSQNWQEVYVFFKHEDAAAGPKLAARFVELASGG